jgi:hypothetical protein
MLNALFESADFLQGEKTMIGQQRHFFFEGGTGGKRLATIH